MKEEGSLMQEGNESGKSTGSRKLMRAAIIMGGKEELRETRRGMVQRDEEWADM